MGDPLRHSLPATPCPNAPHNLRALLSYLTKPVMLAAGLTVVLHVSSLEVWPDRYGYSASDARPCTFTQVKEGRNATHFRLDL